MTHIIWDWNGTLYDDHDIAINAISAWLVSLGGRPITGEDYRDHYTRPIVRFYERLLERPISPDEWEKAAAFFHDAYLDHMGEADLTYDAVAAIDRNLGSGGTQSILSMSWESTLIRATTRFGLSERMVRIDGCHQDAGGSKSPHLEDHINRLVTSHGIDRSRMVAIGDTCDDADAAKAVGIPCVLYDGGAHHRSDLALVGVPIVSTLVEGVDLASRLVTRQAN